MAFGDIVQQAKGTNADAITLPANVVPGNSILLFGWYRTYEGGKPTSVGDNLNPGNYAEVWDTGIYAQDRPDSTAYMLSGTVAGALTVSVVDSAPIYWVLVEVEGALQFNSVGGTNYDHTGTSATITTPSATVASGSVSFAASLNGNVNNNLAPSDSAWAPEIADQASLEVFDRTDSASAAISFGGTLGQADEWAAGWASFTTAATSPTITEINTTNEVTPGEAATLTGTNLTNATGLNIGSVSQADFSVVSGTSVTFTGTRGGNPYNQDLTATLISPDGNATITVQQVPGAGEQAVTAVNPNTTDDASLATQLVDTATGNPVTVVNGDQVWARDYEALSTPEVPFTINPDFTITAGNTGTFIVQFRQASEGVWGSDQTVSFVVPGGGVDPVDPSGDSIRSTVRDTVRDTLRSTRRTL